MNHRINWWQNGKLDFERWIEPRLSVSYGCIKVVSLARYASLGRSFDLPDLAIIRCLVLPGRQEAILRLQYSRDLSLHIGQCNQLHHFWAEYDAPSGNSIRKIYASAKQQIRTTTIVEMNSESVAKLAFLDCTFWKYFHFGLIFLLSTASG